MPIQDSRSSSSTPTPGTNPVPAPALASTSSRVKRSSFSQSSTSTLQTIDEPLSRGRILVKHGKYVLAGGLGCWWLDVRGLIAEILEGERGWIRRTTIAAIGLHGVTVVIFLYLVAFLPWLRGYIPNYPKWQQSARLRVIVPLLTGTIFLGWTCLVISLSQAGKRSLLAAVKDTAKGIAAGDVNKARHQGLGTFGSMAGATAVYTLTLGILGLIPTPRGAPAREKKA